MDDKQDMCKRRKKRQDNETNTRPTFGRFSVLSLQQSPTPVWQRPPKRVGSVGPMQSRSYGTSSHLHPAALSSSEKLRRRSAARELRRPFHSRLVRLMAAGVDLQLDIYLCLDALPLSPSASSRHAQHAARRRAGPTEEGKIFSRREARARLPVPVTPHPWALANRDPRSPMSLVSAGHPWRRVLRILPIVAATAPPRSSLQQDGGVGQGCGASSGNAVTRIIVIIWSGEMWNV